MSLNVYILGRGILLHPTISITGQTIKIRQYEKRQRTKRILPKKRNQRKIKTMHSQSNIIIFISIITVIKHSSCAPHRLSHPHSRCHHQYNSHRYPLHTSHWEHELSENFSPIIDGNDDSQIHILQLRDKIANLFSTIQEMKDDFTVNDSFKQEWIHLLCQKGIGTIKWSNISSS